MHRLAPGAKYYYVFGSTEGDGGYSEERVFTAPPIPGPNVTTRILAYGGVRIASSEHKLFTHFMSCCVQIWVMDNWMSPMK